jgi:hypothetical protein
MSTYFASHRMNNSGHPLDGRLRGYYRGLVPQVQRVTGYDPKIWERAAPTSSKWLENHTSHTGHDPTSPGQRGGATYLNITNLRNEPYRAVPP